MTIDLQHDKLALIIHQIAKREKTTHTAVLERLLRIGLDAERQRILAERTQAAFLVLKPGEHPPPAQQRGYVIEDPCSEDVLRRVCGEDWSLCWWLSTCALAPW